MYKRYFPTFWTIVLLISIAWFLRELGYIELNIPWLPAILMIISIGAIVNHYQNVK